MAGVIMVTSALGWLWKSAIFHFPELWCLTWESGIQPIPGDDSMAHQQLRNALAHACLANGRAGCNVSRNSSDVSLFFWVDSLGQPVKHAAPNLVLPAPQSSYSFAMMAVTFIHSMRVGQSACLDHASADWNHRLLLGWEPPLLHAP